MVWGSKKVGQGQQILLSRSYESYGKTVYDLRWTLKPIHSKEKDSHTVTITERANKWNMRQVIRRIEKHELVNEIEKLTRHNASVHL